MRPKTALFSILLCVASSPTFAEASVNEALSWIDGTDITRAGMMRITLASVQNGLSWANASLYNEGKPRIFCMPDEFSPTPDQVVDILRRYRDKHPQTAGPVPYGAGVMMAMKATFPCK